ncbi:MAG: galactosyltransferase-related protein, partial [bacterium]|nr:galactosyltransferase-related protein [bacterium]
EDNTSEVVRGFHDERLVYLPDRHMGNAATRNRAVAASAGEVLLFLDDDLVIAPGLVKQHCSAHRQADNLVARGPVVWVDRLSLPEGYKVKFTDIPCAFFSINVSLRRKVFDQVGGFDENFTGYGWEDLELGHRLRSSGCRALVLKNAPVFHYYTPPQPEDISQRLESACHRATAQGRSAAYFYHKHPHWRVALSTRLNPVNMFVDRVLSAGNWCEALCRRVLSGDAVWQRPSLAGQALRLVSDRCYFAAAREALAGYVSASVKKDDFIR